MPAPVVHVCSCKRTFTALQWEQLLYVGLMIDDVQHCELRTCLCGSTRAMEVPMTTRETPHFVRSVQFRMRHQGMTLEAAVRNFIKHNPATSAAIADELGSWPASDLELAMFQKVYK